MGTCPKEGTLAEYRHPSAYDCHAPGLGFEMHSKSPELRFQDLLTNGTRVVRFERVTAG